MFFEGFPSPGADVQVFTGVATGTGTSAEWQTWRKPAGKSLCWMLCLGGGGGGGGGFTRAASAAGGGGGGGGSSGQAILVIAALSLPDRLYVQAGVGGPGGAAGAAGTNATPSMVCVAPTAGAGPMNQLAGSGTATPASGGGGGTGAAVGAGGSQNTAPLIGSNQLVTLAQYLFLAGQAGSAGGAVAGAIGAPVALPTTGLRCMGGAGGAGTTSADFAGGRITAISTSVLSDSAPANAAAGSFGDSAGYALWKGLHFYCGLGGGSSNAGVGGFGGAGSYGSGGGGGGAGTTGGSGGNGGPGLVVIVSY